MHWNDKELPKISLQAHLLWIATWNFSDDEGVFESDLLLLKSQIFPRRTDVRVEQIQSWLDQLVSARFLIPFEYKNEGYYVSRTFKTHQRIDKAQPSVIPKNVLKKVFDDHYENAIGTLSPVLDSKVKEGRGEDSPAQEILNKKEKEVFKPPENEVFFTIEHCVTVAMSDDRWVRANKTSKKELEEFNSVLEKRGVYEKNPLDYKNHFANWKKTGKKDDLLNFNQNGNNQAREEKSEQILGDVEQFRSDDVRKNSATGKGS